MTTFHKGDIVRVKTAPKKTSNPHLYPRFEVLGMDHDPVTRRARLHLHSLSTSRKQRGYAADYYIVTTARPETKDAAPAPLTGSVRSSGTDEVRTGASTSASSEDKVYHEIPEWFRLTVEALLDDGIGAQTYNQRADGPWDGLYTIATELGHDRRDIFAWVVSCCAAWRP